MEEDIHKKETKAEKQDLSTSTSHHPLLPHNPHTRLMITGVDLNRQHIYYNITENQEYSHFVSELQNKYIIGWYGGLMVLKDMSTDDCSIINILTMEKLQLPPLCIPVPYIYGMNTNCVISSSKMDTTCRVVYVEKRSGKFKSCHVGDSEYAEGEGEWIYQDGGAIRDLINFRGKLYALTTKFNLVASDFSDPDLHLELVVSGESRTDFYFDGSQNESEIRLAECCESLLLIYMHCYDHEVSGVKIFKADFSIGEWVELETLGDRVLFLGSLNNTFSSPAPAIGMKGNAIYWVATLFNPSHTLFNPSHEFHLHMYDIEDKSISVSLLIPDMETCSSLSFVSFPMTCHEEKKPEHSCSLLEALPIETNFHVQRVKATKESSELQIELRQPQKGENLETIGSRIVKKESLWADLPNDLLLEIFPHLLAGDRVMFRSVCRSWYSISPSSKSSQECLLPLKISDRSSPELMCHDNETYHPICGELYSMDFPHIPGAEVRAARDGWLLMAVHSYELLFYNPFTKEQMELPECDDVVCYYSVFFSAPPTSADCLVVVATERWDGGSDICYMNCGDESWTCHKLPLEDEFLGCFSSCNAIVYKGLFYFLLYGGKTLIFDPEEDDVHVIEVPNFFSEFSGYNKQYMLESDGKLIAVFVSVDGSLVYTCEWNMSTSKWELLLSLGNMMLFISRPLSLCIRATVSGTSNKIYFPMFSDNGRSLFYSLATRRYHTLEMGTSYPNFYGSKFYTPHNCWFMS